MGDPLVDAFFGMVAGAVEQQTEREDELARQNQMRALAAVLTRAPSYAAPGLIPETPDGLRAPGSPIPGSEPFLGGPGASDSAGGPAASADFPFGGPDDVPPPIHVDLAPAGPASLAPGSPIPLAPVGAISALIASGTIHVERFTLRHADDPAAILPEPATLLPLPGTLLLGSDEGVATSGGGDTPKLQQFGPGSIIWFDSDGHLRIGAATPPASTSRLVVSLTITSEEPRAVGIDPGLPLVVGLPSGAADPFGVSARVVLIPLSPHVATTDAATTPPSVTITIPVLPGVVDATGIQHLGELAPLGPTVRFPFGDVPVLVGAGPTTTTRRTIDELNRARAWGVQHVFDSPHERARVRAALDIPDADWSAGEPVVAAHDDNEPVAVEPWERPPAVLVDEVPEGAALVAPGSPIPMAPEPSREDRQRAEIQVLKDRYAKMDAAERARWENPAAYMDDPSESQSGTGIPDIADASPPAMGLVAPGSPIPMRLAGADAPFAPPGRRVRIGIGLVGAGFLLVVGSVVALQLTGGGPTTAGARVGQPTQTAAPTAGGGGGALTVPTTRPTTSVPGTAVPPPLFVVIASNGFTFGQAANDDPAKRCKDGGTATDTIKLEGIPANTPVVVKLTGPGLPSSITLTANPGVPVSKSFQFPPGGGSFSSTIVSIGGNAPPTSGAQESTVIQCTP